jgi:hypothetical protein
MARSGQQKLTDLLNGLQERGALKRNAYPIVLGNVMLPLGTIPCTLTVEKLRALLALANLYLGRSTTGEVSKILLRRCKRVQALRSSSPAPALFRPTGSVPVRCIANYARSKLQGMFVRPLDSALHTAAANGINIAQGAGSILHRLNKPGFQSNMGSTSLFPRDLRTIQSKLSSWETSLPTGFGMQSIPFI